MANESQQTFKYKNFKQILSYYAKLTKQAMMEPIDGLGANTPFMPPFWKVPEYDTTVDGQTVLIGYTTYENSGYVYGKAILDAYKKTSDSILEALRTLFINYDDPKEIWQEDFNFNLLNAYASASQSLQWYNEETEEFEDMPEYWFTRGCWYEMLPMCTKGDYIKTWHSNVLSAIRAIKKCRQYYQTKFVYYIYEPSYDDYYYSSYYSRREYYSDYGNSMGYIRSFWANYLSVLQDEINPLLNPIWKLGRETNLKEQTAETAKLTYVTQLASDLDIAFTAGNTIASTAKTLSTSCGTYSAKAAGLSLSK